MQQSLIISADPGFVLFVHFYDIVRFDIFIMRSMCLYVLIKSAPMATHGGYHVPKRPVESRHKAALCVLNHRHIDVYLGYCSNPFCRTNGPISAS